MPKHLKQHSVRLEFTGDDLVHSNLSGAAFIDNQLWVAGDEAAGLMRLDSLPPLNDEILRFGNPKYFKLADYLDLPDLDDVEADLEGMAYESGYLWIVGSHGIKRKAPKADKSNAQNLKRLSNISFDGNRCLIARIPMVKTEAGFEPRKVTDDGRKASLLSASHRRNELTDELRLDKHLAPFLSIPGKDNGFDVEGLARIKNRCFLGLRGPVLRGWSCMIEIEVRDKKIELGLQNITTGKQPERYRKHFMDLHGLGIRDLFFDDNDLYILAGPTMVLDAPIRVFKWVDAAITLGTLSGNEQDFLWDNGPVEVMSLPFGKGMDRAEAITRIPESLLADPGHHWLILYDAPSAARQVGEFVVLADILMRANIE